MTEAPLRFPDADAAYQCPYCLDELRRGIPENGKCGHEKVGLTATLLTLFEALDTNGDGVMTADEVLAHEICEVLRHRLSVRISGIELNAALRACGIKLRRDRPLFTELG